MVLSGNNSVNIGNAFLQLRIYWEATQDVTNNTSTITARLYVYIQNGSLSIGSRSDATMSIDGTTIGFIANAVNVSNYTGEVLLGTVSRTISHNADGTKSAVVSGTWPLRATINSTYFASVTVSTTANLDTIPRASTPTLSHSSRALGEAVTISTNRASTAFTHTIKYAIGSETGTIATGVGVSTSWTLPSSLANAITNSTSGSVTITCETYNGSTLIGTRSVQLTATVPNTATYQPSAAISSITEGASGLTEFTVFVQNKSRLRVQSSGSGKFGASIAQRRVTIDGSTYLGADITSVVLTKSGTIAVTLRVTDSRGYFTEVTQNVTLVAYANPRVVSFDAFRCNSDGTPNPQGSFIKMEGTSLISSVNNQNLRSTVIRYRERGTTNWTNGASSTTLYNPTLTAVVAADGNKSFETQIYMFDYFIDASQMIDIGTAFQLLNFNANGDGIGFGKVSERSGFDFGSMPMLDGVPIIESGSNTNGYYIKYADGTLICYGTTTYTAAIVSAWGSLFTTGGVYPTITYPATFIAPPSVSVQSSTVSASAWPVLGTANVTLFNFFLARATTAASQTLGILWCAIGRWKA